MTLRPRHVVDAGRDLVMAEKGAPSAFGSSTQGAPGSLSDVTGYKSVTENFPTSKEVG